MCRSNSCLTHSNRPSQACLLASSSKTRNLPLLSRSSLKQHSKRFNPLKPLGSAYLQEQVNVRLSTISSSSSTNILQHLPRSSTNSSGSISCFCKSKPTMSSCDYTLIVIAFPNNAISVKLLKLHPWSTACSCYTLVQAILLSSSRAKHFTAEICYIQTTSLSMLLNLR